MNATTFTQVDIWGIHEFANGVEMHSDWCADNFSLRQIECSHEIVLFFRDTLWVINYFITIVFLVIVVVTTSEIANHGRVIIAQVSLKSLWLRDSWLIVCLLLLLLLIFVILLLLFQFVVVQHIHRFLDLTNVVSLNIGDLVQLPN